MERDDILNVPSRVCSFQITRNHYRLFIVSKWYGPVQSDIEHLSYHPHGSVINIIGANSSIDCNDVSKNRIWIHQSSTNSRRRLWFGIEAKNNIKMSSQDRTAGPR